MEWSKEELEAYDALGIFIQDERGRIEYALEEGIKIGEEKGKKEGIKLGEEKGIKKGKIEGKKETAKELLNMGIEIEKIARATGLKKEEIEKLT